MNSRNEDDLRGGFRRLREQDAAQALPFALTWSRAQTRAESARLVVATIPRRRTASAPWVERSGWRLWVKVAPARPPLFAGLAVAAAMLIGVFAWDRQPIIAPVPVPVAVASLAEWRAPSDVLLRTSDRVLMRGMPHFGAPIPGWPSPLTLEIQDDS